ncbi:hypothetical protein [Marinifaba aquimaris]|nr:hypothetical protein [Marinifaba aquimaris]
MVKQSQQSAKLVKIADIAHSPIHYMHLFSQKPPAKVQQFVKLLKEQL